MSIRWRFVALGAAGMGFGIGFGCSGDDEVPSISVDAGNDGGTYVPEDGSNVVADSQPPNPEKDSGADVYVPPPTLLSVSPESAVAGTPFTLQVVVQGALPGARVLVNGVVAPTAPPPDSGPPDADAAAGTTLEVSVPALDATGLVPVVVENAPGAASATFYIAVSGDGGLQVFDFNPDYGNPGDTIEIVGRDLPATVTLTDSQGLTASGVKTDAGKQWGDDGSGEVMTFVVPTGWHSGQVTVRGPSGPAFRGGLFNVGTNLSKAATATASTEYSSGYPASRGNDGTLPTSWFSARYDCASLPECTTKPFFVVAFDSAKSIGRIALRGNREYRNPYDFIRGRLEILGPKAVADGGEAPDAAAPRTVLWSQTVHLPNPKRDLDVRVSPPVSGYAVRFISEVDESNEPGFAELETFEN